VKHLVNRCTISLLVALQRDSAAVFVAFSVGVCSKIGQMTNIPREGLGRGIDVIALPHGRCGMVGGHVTAIVVFAVNEVDQ
jgi:hypothetical protein